MNSKPAYDSWYAPMDPFAIVVLGAVTIIMASIIVWAARVAVSDPSQLIRYGWVFGAVGGCYALGLVVYYAGNRILNGVSNE